MNEINPVKHNKINFKGTPKMEKEIKTLEMSVKEFIHAALEKINTPRIPEYGDFAPFYEQFANLDKTLGATDFMLKISKPPKNIEGHQKIRNLEVIAYKLPLQYKAERIVATGTNEELLKQLKSPEIVEKIKNATRSLSESLDDI